MWEHGSGFTEQPNFWEEMNASPLCSQAGLGSSLGGDERPDCSSQESLEPSHCLGSLFSAEGMCSLLFVVSLSASVLLVGVPLPPYAFRHPWKRRWIEPTGSEAET